MADHRFTAYQYDQAILSLQEAKKQLEPNGHCCSICTDSGHMAWECGHNPLLAVSMCQDIAISAENLHQWLHFLAGYENAFGEQLGPAKCSLPARSEAEEPQFEIPTRERNT